MNICRLCLVCILPKKIQNDISYELKQSILYFFNIQLEQTDDHLPYRVCDRCSILIKDFDDFHKFVLKNQEHLLQYKSKELLLNTKENLIKSIEEKSVPSNENRFETYRCKICNKQMYNQDEYDIHQFYHEGPQIKEQAVICDICGRDFQSERYLKIHLKKHETNPQNCSVCSKEYGNLIKLENHLVRFHLPSIFVTCTICGRICRTKHTLQAHIDKLHKSKESVRCDKCNVVLKDYKALQRHIFIKHDLSSLKYKCKYCGKMFARKLSWMDHEASHINLAKYECEFCNRKFVSSSNYCNHRIKTHPKEYALMKMEQSRLQYSNIDITVIND